METTSISPPPLFTTTPISNKFTNYAKSRVGFACRRRRCGNSIENRRSLAITSAIDDNVSSLTDPVQTEVTWQIIVGAIAGVSPFVVAGVEFSKRIIAQRRCEECGGSGLILREKDYYKCPECGGFLPWQSWKRFFTG